MPFKSRLRIDAQTVETWITWSSALDPPARRRWTAKQRNVDGWKKSPYKLAPGGWPPGFLVRKYTFENYQPWRNAEKCKNGHVLHMSHCCKVWWSNTRLLLWIGMASLQLQVVKVATKKIRMADQSIFAQLGVVESTAIIKQPVESTSFKKHSPPTPGPSQASSRGRILELWWYDRLNGICLRQNASTNNKFPPTSTTKSFGESSWLLVEVIKWPTLKIWAAWHGECEKSLSGIWWP